MKSDITKENIIKHTIALIRETDGNTDSITMRKIAQRAGVGVGLINHYFVSKDHLIEVCVQSIIGSVILSFRPQPSPAGESTITPGDVAKQVMDFLIQHKQISRVSILGDMNRPAEDDNTMKTALGLTKSMSGGRITPKNMMESFMIISVLQAAFLRKEVLKECIGVDMYDKVQRDELIDTITERFWTK